MAGVKQPSDKSHFILPDLGEGLVEAELISWKVNPGERVKEQQTLCEMQTDKALVEVPSPWTGLVSELCGGAGDIIKVGAVLVRYKIDAGAMASAPAKASGCVSASVAAAVNAEGDQGTVVGTMSGTLDVGSRFARRDAEHLTANAGAASANGAKALATPAVRGVAKKLGIDINRVAGTGRGGRVTASDVEVFADRASASPSGGAATAPRAIPAPVPLPPVDADGVAQRIPFRGVRRKIAESLTRSIQTAVHFTVTNEADVTALDARRRESSKVVGRKISMLPFVMRAVCAALRRHPSLNAIVDDAKSEILIKGVINLSMAVDTDSGLMVPVLHGADQKSVLDLADGVKRLADRCRDRTISREESLGGTFTISNVGSYGGVFATPIINYPEVAILAVGRAREQVMVKDGRFYAGLSLPLSLACDHRVVDGAEGARFLNTVVGFLEDPAALLG
ncbi:MAG: dihydrolipoamide acetyltransferase family protein [Planctomycetota bacterium]|nr:dihydrolipoamide acetyltransferase family protein [Planctomycetota bacterium]MDA1105441.1 dihydrolipoamide acetyltransferase family protein [Planctomycetota bacterium]